MLTNEEIYLHIPKPVEKWTTDDVQRWFQLQKIEPDPHFDFAQYALDGPAFRQLTPQFLSDNCGITSRLVIKIVLQWIQQDMAEFNQMALQAQSSVCSLAEEQPVEANQAEKENCPANKERAISPKHLQAVVALVNVQKWKSRRKAHPEEQKQEEPIKGEPYRSVAFAPESVKQISSLYEICQHFIRFEFNGMILEFEQGVSIGRETQNDLFIKEGSVSRRHANITRIGSEYYLRDVGSKYGTYIEMGFPFDKALELGDMLAFDDYYLQIVKLKFYPQAAKPSFDLQACLHKAKQKVIVNFYVREYLSIGREGDIVFNYPAIKSRHACIKLEDGDLRVVPLQGQSFRRLRQEEMLHLQQSQTIRFGLQKVKITKQRKTKPVNYQSELIPKAGQ